MDGEQTTFSYSPPSSPHNLSPQSVFNSIREAYTLQVTETNLVYLHSMKDVWNQVINLDGAKTLRWEQFKTLQACCNSIATSARHAAILLKLPNVNSEVLQTYYFRIMDDRARLLEIVDNIISNRY
jgi:hypothetical protein